MKQTLEGRKRVQGDSNLLDLVGGDVGQTGHQLVSVGHERRLLHHSSSFFSIVGFGGDVDFSRVALFQGFSGF